MTEQQIAPTPLKPECITYTAYFQLEGKSLGSCTFTIHASQDERRTSIAFLRAPPACLHADKVQLFREF